MKQKKEPWTGNRILQLTWKIISAGISILMLLFFLTIFANFFGAIIPETLTGNVAVIPIEGVISSDGDSWHQTVKSSSIIKQIEKADKNSEIKALLLEINSPGGTPVATDEVAQAVKAANKTTIAVIRETGASGAYWIATAADRIFANRMSITGSIGVQASKLGFEGLLADYNVTYRKLTAGTLKDAGTPFREMTPEEKLLYQQLLDKLHNEFIKAVAENRNLPEAKVRELATGFVYLGAEAKELGLVDEIGSKKDALKYLEQQLNITAQPIEYKEKKTFFQELSGLTADNFYQIGRGLGSVFATDTAISFT
ncbi:MAG: signal peptide peptidase SppA [Candidatus Woesearchaeota archaeon]